MNGTAAAHGTYARYAGRPQCRCEPCKAAKAQYARRMRRTCPGAPAPSHGTRHSYEYYGCRCEPCRAAKAASRAREKRAAR